MEDVAGRIADAGNSRREAILGAAVDLFREQGFANTTTDEIAAAAGMTKRTMYRYIGSKHRILVDLQDRLMGDVLNHHASFDESEADPDEQLRIFLERHGNLVTRRSGDVRVIFEEMKYVSKEEGVEFIRRRDEFEAYVRRMIQKGVDSGRFDVADVAVAGSAVLGALNGIRRWDDETIAALKGKLPEWVAAVLLEGLLRTASPKRQRVSPSELELPEPFANSPSSSSRDDWAVNEVLAEVTTQAARLFHRVGYPRLSTTEIADAAGISKPALYYYIGRKEELLYRVMRGVLVEFVAAQRIARAEGVAGVELLAAAIGAYCHVLVGNIDAVGVLEAEYKFLSAEHQDDIRQAEAILFAYLEDAIVQAAAAQCRGIRQGHAAALLLAGMLNDMHRWYARTGRIGEEEISRDILELFLHGIVGPPRDGTPSASQRSA
ncbi:MAG TPA: TetR family transcriptional regulator [Jatrophihabitantaceae bacterium]|nr:TetR family transcriptional regulator [Jatrophihabitantaceae bacterium]